MIPLCVLKARLAFKMTALVKWTWRRGLLSTWTAAEINSRIVRRLVGVPA